MGKIWNDAAVRYLQDRRICPRCDARLSDEWCPGCGADLSGPLGGALESSTERVVNALRGRDRLIERIPTVWRSGAPALGTPAVGTPPMDTAAMGPSAVDPAAVGAAGPQSVSVPQRPAAPVGAREPVGVPAAVLSAAPDAGAQVSVQSVLAFAGAALLAVAALVFTFFNPDLTSFAVRTSIIGAITLVFLGGAWWFARRGLQFSAESVAALGVVFVGLDVWAFTQLAPSSASGWVFAALGTLAGSAVLFGLGARSGVRVWLWAAVVGLALSPGLLGSGGNAWGAILGSLGVAVVALGLHPVLARLSPGLGSALGVERYTATALQAVAVLAALLQLLVRSISTTGTDIAGYAGILAVLAVVAALGSRNGLPRPWSFAAGAFAVAAVAILPLAVSFEDSAWYLALVPVAGGIALVGLAALPSSPAASRGALGSGAVTVLILAATPALVTAVVQLSGALFAPLRWAGSVAGGYPGETSPFPASGDFAFVAGSNPSYGPGLVAQNVGLASIVALAALTATAWAVAQVSRRTAAPAPAGPPQPVPAGPATGVSAPNRLALWLGVFTLLTISGWAGLSITGQAVVGLVLTAALIAGLLFVPALVAAPPTVRRAVGGGAHLLLLLAAITGWSQESTTVWVGAAAVLALASLARALPARWRPLYLAVGYAYALVNVATALTLVGVDGIAVLCLTTTLGLLCALAATLTTWLTPRSWYALLLVSAVPFLAGIVAVLLVRSGWTALSTGVAFALALTLMTVRRPGMTIALRSFAAALLVPSLAVVVVCLGAQLLATSGSPVVLPLIALLVAGTFAATGPITQALEKHGLTALEADACRRWIEASAALTGVLAVLLALVRTAAGLSTTVLVLVILGVGAAVNALRTGRQLAWWAAGASWTGALWCVWASRGIEVIEPYLLPPALAMVVVGAILVARGRTGQTLAATGLALAVVPSLAVLVTNGSAGFGAAQLGSVRYGLAQFGPAIPWRAYGLIAAALLLVLVGYAIARAATRATGPGAATGLGSLLGSTAVVATLAAAAGAAQAMRWGLGLDALAGNPTTGVMLPVLALSALATLLAALAGGLPQGGTASGDTAADGMAGTASGGPASRDTSPSRWRFAAATAFLVAGPITAIRADAFSIGTLTLLMVAVLGFMLVVAARSRSTATSLPPVWFLFLLAWCAAVAGWSERELRVEAFSLPLGLALLGAGIIGMRPGARTVPARLGSWPSGFAGSWRLLAPGIIVTFLPSVLATGTDPQTWRAILVMSLALTAILIGSTRRLAAPFLISLAVLPIEVIVVFTVQIGQTINPLLWWITLATIGAVMLVIAITSERKGATEAGLSARLRDLT
ncbi:SCO7613 C-terminal domain-containing membrane protein [Cryobacterium sp. SO1]|uniref:SCO7613 C-terminal domain-containing membrane protein n=1 Tax=Cryobacterium sp. SO1 TaxID=1897061 RepID=UPI00210B6DB2|nr:hypothetical protein [Cryobacterium sp. SO1]